MKLTRNGTPFIIQIILNGTVVGSSTSNCEYSRDSTMLGILSKKGYFYFKNIKLKV